MAQRNTLIRRIKKITYIIQKEVFTFLGDIKIFGWKHPLWFEINAHGYRLKGEHYRSIQNLIKPGDILIRQFYHYLSSYMIPGIWDHAGIYVGTEKELVVHAISEGVAIEDILNFMRTDNMMILRPPTPLVEDGIKRAFAIVGAPYDFGFDFTDCNRFSCTELVDYCYPGLVFPQKRTLSFGKKVIVADDFENCSQLIKVWDSRLKN